MEVSNVKGILPVSEAADVTKPVSSVVSYHDE